MKKDQYGQIFPLQTSFDALINWVHIIVAQYLKHVQLEFITSTLCEAAFIQWITV